MTEASRHGLAVGRLLLATPALRDPNFARTVVLLLDVNDAGALGVVLNRPSDVPVTSVLPGWSGALSEPPVLLHGGPVAGDSALGLAVLADGAGEDPVGFRRTTDVIGIVDLDTPADRLAPSLGGMRVFAGYAGWGPGQLESECDEGSWTVVPSRPEDVFGTSPGTVWEQVHRRQGGETAWLATMPVDPTRN